MQSIKIPALFRVGSVERMSPTAPAGTQGNFNLEGKIRMGLLAPFFFIYRLTLFIIINRGGLLTR
jgi:hypothetical protein